MSEGLKCTYCHEPLPEEVGPNYGLYRCPACRRILFVRERLRGMRVGADNLVAPLALGLLVVLFSLMLALLGWALGSWPLILVGVSCVALFGVYFIYDGWLSIVTGVNNFKGRVSKGGEAIFGGLVCIALGAFVIACIVWGVVGWLTRGAGR